MAGSFSSIWKGSQIDSAVGVIRNSGVSAEELTVLKNVLAGTVDGSKALVVDSSKNLGTFNILDANIYKGNLLQLQERTSDPIENPPSGYAYLYIKSGQLYKKTSSGAVNRIGGGTELEYLFTNQTSVVCGHNLNKKYVQVDVIGADDKPLTGQVQFQDVNTVLVSFNHAQSGRVIIRTN
jgi:hypothetical protein